MKNSRQITTPPFTIVLVLFCWFFTTHKSYSSGLNRSVTEPPILERLAAMNEKAVPLFEQATMELDSGHLEQAKQLYLDVLELAPDFPDAMRRLGSIYMRSELDSARYYLQQAVLLDSSAFNLAGLAHVLYLRNSISNQATVLELLRKAGEKAPDDEYILQITIAAGLEYQFENVWKPATKKLLVVTPDDPTALYFGAIYAGEEGDNKLMQSRLERAVELGFDAQTAQQVKNYYIPPNYAHIWKPILYAAILWAAGMGLLFAIGFFLNKMTLKSIDKAVEPGVVVKQTERNIRNFYKAIINITSLYYYISIPFVIVLVIAAVGAIFYLFMIAGVLPIKLAAILFIGAIYTVFILIKSVFLKRKFVEPGRSLTHDEAPGLWDLVSTVADRVGTRRVDKIYITPLSEVAVIEHGTIMQKLSETAERCLILGIGTLNGLKRSELAAILAHEYGHFAHRDTAGGNVSIQVNSTMTSTAIGLASQGLAAWYNPAWLFLNAFHRIFMRVTLGASRLQEILADRYAVMNYGAKAFVSGLKHVIKRDLELNLLAVNEINDALEHERQPENFYRLVSKKNDQQQIDAQLEKELHATPSNYDSHPPAQKRFELAEKIKTDTIVFEEDGDAWDLISIRDELEVKMTSDIFKNASGRH